MTFNDVASPFSFGTQYNFSVNSDEDLTTNTVPQNPAIVDTQVCTATDCSFPTSFNDDPSDEFLLYPPGAPKVDSIAPASGPETGGTQVTITGENLGCATGVFFGSTAAEQFSNTEAFLDCGLTDTLTVTAPPGTVGTVPVTVTTVESDATGDTPTTDASFTYTAAPTLTVAKTGAGSGTVTSSPSGIDCGATCSHKYAPGTPVTLTAAAAAGSVFSGWSGGGCSGTGDCFVTVNSSSSVTATFDLAPETLTVTKTGNGANGGTVTSSPVGISCQFTDTTCSHPFAHGTTVTLTALGSLHVTFEGWSGGGCSGAGSCTVTMNSATTVTANFKVTGGPPVVNGLRRAEAQGQDAESSQARAQGPPLQDRQGQARLLEQGEEGASHLAEAEGGQAAPQRGEGQPRAQQGQEAQALDRTDRGGARRGPSAAGQKTNGMSILVERLYAG